MSLDPPSPASPRPSPDPSGDEEEIVDFFPHDPDRVRPFVHQDDDSVSLYFEISSIQSRMRLDDPAALDLDYTRAMMACLLLRPQPRSVLLIGLGGGSLVKYGHRHVRSAAFTAVEINPHVIGLREAFRIPPDDERLGIVCEDGAAFVARPGAGFDVVMVDGFNYDGQPEALCTAGFYSHCRHRLAPGGVLVVNLHADGETEHTLAERIAQAFEGQVLSIRSEDRGNRIVFAGRPCRPGQGLGALRKAWSTLPEVHRRTLERVWPALQRAVIDRG